MKQIARKQENTAPWISMVLYLLIAYVLTMGILLILAFLLYKTNLSLNAISWGIIASYVISCFTAGLLAGKKMKHRRFAWGLVMGVAYYLVLLVISVIGNQSFGAVTDSLFTGLIFCVGGGMLGGMMS